MAGEPSSRPFSFEPDGFAGHRRWPPSRQDRSRRGIVQSLPRSSPCIHLPLQVLRYPFHCNRSFKHPCQCLPNIRRHRHNCATLYPARTPAEPSAPARKAIRMTESLPVSRSSSRRGSSPHPYQRIRSRRCSRRSMREIQRSSDPC